MGYLERFNAYAASFEGAFKSDDWSDVALYFSEDAVYEIVADPPLAALHEGRDAILAYFRLILDSFDRRFDSRDLELLEGPLERDGGVWMRWRVTYTLSGAPDLVIEGEEIAEYEEGLISRLEDRYTPEQSAVFSEYLARHGEQLASKDE